MDSLSRDLSRLDLIVNMSIGQERMGPALHFKDFMHYYFTRFITNLTHVLKDFTTSEIEGFNRRHASKIEYLAKYPALPLDDLIVPIPKGMIQPYKQTTKTLQAVLAAVGSDTLVADMQTLLDHMVPGKIKEVNLPLYTKSQFDTARNDIARLFGKTGLLHSTGGHVLVSKTDILSVNTNLIDITKVYYPNVLSLNQLVKTLEGHYGRTQWNDKDKTILSGQFMSLAYRLSIFATVMDRVQELEHGFTKSLQILLQKIA